MFVPVSELNFDAYDVIIAGSGFAGVSSGMRLAQGGKKVLLLETGAAEYDDAIQVEFASMYGRGHFDGSYWPQHWIRALGGTSLLWEGWVIPLLERDMAPYWPISRASLDPYYAIAARDLLRTPVFLNYTAPFAEGFTYRPFSSEPPVRLGEEPLDRYTKTPGLDVALQVTLSRLVPRPDRSGIAMIEVYNPDTGRRSVPLRPAQSIILAAGGIGNAQILLNSSDATNSVSVGNERDQVGRYLMEHPHIFGCARIVVPEPIIFPSVPAEFGENIPAIIPNDDLFRNIGRRDVSITFSQEVPNSKDSIEQLLTVKNGPTATVYSLTVRSEMAPEADNRVVLAEGSDASGLRRVRAMCTIGADAFRAIDACLVGLGAALAKNGPGRLRIDNNALHRGVTGGGHILGTTRMGTDPATSVVDPDCRVHGYENLYIGGSSVFPSGGYENPTLTIIALATRLADKILGKL